MSHKRTDLLDRLAEQSEGIAGAVWTTVRPLLNPCEGLCDAVPELTPAALGQALNRSIELFRHQRQLPADDLMRCTEPAVVLAEHGARIGPLLQAWDLGSSTMLAECWARARPGEQKELATYTQWVTRTVAGITTEIGAAYSHTLKQTGLGLPRRVLAEMMVSGSVNDELASAARHEQTGRYLVLAFGLADGTVPGPATVALGAAALAADDTGLCCQVEQHVCVLVPLRSQETPAVIGAHVLDRLRQADLAVRLPVGAVMADRSKLDDAARRAITVESLGAAAGLARAVIEENEIISELAMLRDRSYQEELVALIDPLRHHPDLIETLRTLYSMDLDRTRTARRLNVARRTLTYRIEKIEQLTGINPIQTRGIQSLTLALTAQSLLATA
ncbi:PucR family transcriptional regulator [Streptomyces sp. NPDC101151]|uniref:PucR family transcriptional regulator n=1 Tax=Streptomyces sp. NPDC101151 TaxID=3366115 RepID=UPI003817EB94